MKSRRERTQVTVVSIIDLLSLTKSMIGKAFFAALSRSIGIGQQRPGDPTCELSFGGISAILCGDHNQFPPIIRGEREALYWPSKSHDSTESQLRREIFKEFREVVILREQMRVTDTVWRDFLRNLRFGRVQREDLTMLHGQLLTNESCPLGTISTIPKSVMHASSLSLIRILVGLRGPCAIHC